MIFSASFGFKTRELTSVAVAMIAAFRYELELGKAAHN